MFTRQDITSGLVGHWPINEGSGTTINDISGNGHHGTIKDEVGEWITADAPPLNNIAHPANYVGSNYYDFKKDVIEITDSGTHADFQMIKDFTMLAWVNLTHVDPFTCFISKGWGYSVWGFVLNPDNLFRFVVSDGTQSDQVLPNEQWTLNLSGETWIHIGAILDNSTPAKLTLLINGVANTPSVECPYDIVAHDRPFLIGGHANNNSYRTRGSMADVRLYNRQLSESEWRQIYRQATYFKNAQIA